MIVAPVLEWKENRRDRFENHKLTLVIMGEKKDGWPTVGIFLKDDETMNADQLKHSAQIRWAERFVEDHLKHHASLSQYAPKDQNDGS